MVLLGNYSSYALIDDGEMRINMKIDNNHSSGAVLRIISEIKSIDDISMIVETRPTKYFSKGQPYSKRNPNSKIREENIWILESGLSDRELLDSHIIQLLSFLKKRANVMKELQLECHIDIMCSFSSKNGQGGFTLEHELLRELSKYAIDLIVNLYPPGR